MVTANVISFLYPLYFHVLSSFKVWLYVCVFARVRVGVCVCSSGVRLITGSCELPSMGAGNQPRVLCLRRISSEPLSILPASHVLSMETVLRVLVCWDYPPYSHIATGRTRKLHISLDLGVLDNLCLTPPFPPSKLRYSLASGIGGSGKPKHDASLLIWFLLELHWGH